MPTRRTSVAMILDVNRFLLSEKSWTTGFCCALTVVLVAVTACAPVRESYYKPFGQGQRHSVAICGGPPTLMSFEVAKGVGVTVAAWKYDVEQVDSIWIEFFVEEGNVLKLAASAPFITIEVDRRTHTYDVGAITFEEAETRGRITKRVVQATEEMKGALLPKDQRSLVGGIFQNSRSYLAKINVGRLPAKVFELSLPEAYLNGKAIRFDRVRFEFRDEYYWVALMC